MACGACRAAPRPSPLDGATQLLVVTSLGWDADEARLERFERAGSGWRAVGDVLEVNLGASGLGWGRGIHGEGAPAGRAGPVKEEGDARAPAGVFTLGAVFGYDPEAPPGTRLPYLPVTGSWRCVDDPASARYNQVFDAAGLEETWASAEEMRREDDLYRWGVLVEHNRDAVPGAGSCIFLHVGGGPTVGCTAMPAARLLEVIAWLTPDTRLVQLPRTDYDALRPAWRLPRLR